MSTGPANTRYIGEIEGLRAVAVVAVLLYHVGFSRIGGGFVGVDVFFVISGYLMMRILLADSGDSGALRRFYVRRILRIAPALAVTLGVTAVVFYALLPPELSENLLASLASAAFSYSNLWFYLTTDYFGDNARNPVLHTWSLAVEEQFYLFFPLLLLMIARTGLRRHAITVLAGLTALSLVAAGIIAPGNRAGAFYWPWLRAWELLAGSVLAAAPTAALPERLKGPLSSLGLAVIVGACLLYSDKMVFPGFAALPPVLGAVAVIAGAGAGGMANRILNVGVLRWTGRISYSLYLVHWPIVCAASLLFTLHSGKTRVAVLAASFLVAWLSYRFVETPFRRLAGRVPERRVLVALAVACATALPYFHALHLANAMIWRRFPEATQITAFLRTDTSFFRAGTCLLTDRYPDLRYFDEQTCLKRDRQRPGVLVIGDSHAANIVAGLARQHASVDILQATAVGCKPILGASGPPYCTALVRHILLEWLPGAGREIEHVVIAAQWSERDIRGLKRTIAYLGTLNKRVIIYGPSPEYYVPVPLLAAYEQILGGDFDQRLINRERERLDARFKAEFSRDAIYFSSIDSFCRGGICQPLEGGSPLLFDRDHFTMAGTSRLLRGFPLP